MVMMAVCDYLIIPLITICACSAQSVTKLGSFKVSDPAFATLYINANASSPLDKYDLLISTFSAIPFATDTIQIVQSVGKYMKNVAEAKGTIITTKTTWPNEVSGVPENVFGKRVVAIPDGFILPFKTDGKLKLVDISQNPPAGPYSITDDSTGQWFYHRVEWRDMDGDGDMDAVTCRAREPIIGSSKASELLWLENPNGDITVTWKPHVIVNKGPDIFFESVILNTTSGPFHCIVASQFFSKSLSIYWTTDPKGHWTDLSMIRSRVIDDTIGAVFDVKVHDINNDKKLDLLVTNNGNDGSVFVYEIPTDFRNGTFTRHVLSTGYTPLHEGQGKGSPGSSFPIQLSTNMKPLILLSGDDDGHAYLLAPKSENATDWQYQQTTVLATGSDTVGQPAFADVDGDGNLELFIPSYSTSEVFVYRLNTS